MPRHIIFAIVLLCLVSPNKLQAQDPPVADLNKVASLIVDQTNAFRQGHQLQPVKPDDILTKVAKQFAQFMARSGKYGHEAGGRTPAQRVSDGGYDYAIVEENIQMQYDSRGFNTEDLAARAVTGWENSPGHRKNMLNPDVTETGVGVARSSDGHYYAVQLFARPASAQIKFSVTNDTPQPVQYRLLDKTFDLAPRVTRTHTIPSPTAVTFFPDRPAAQSLQIQNAATYHVRAADGKLRVDTEKKD